MGKKILPNNQDVTSLTYDTDNGFSLLLRIISTGVNPYIKIFQYFLVAIVVVLFLITLTFKNIYFSLFLVLIIVASFLLVIGLLKWITKVNPDLLKSDWLIARQLQYERSKLGDKKNKLTEIEDAEIFQPKYLKKKSS